MNTSRSLFLRVSVTTLVLWFLAVCANAQLNPAKHYGEQTSFSVEFDFEHPVPVDEAAKEALATSSHLADDLKQKHLAPKDLPDHWFTASRVHLGDGEVGLVVMGVDGLLAANSTSFWVLRRTSKGYDLVLETFAASLDILKAKTDGLRDIKAGFLENVASSGSQEFQFDGHHYQVTERTSRTTGAKVPTDLTGYETHAPFAQQRADDSSTLAEARAWIWQHWKNHKRFYVTVVVQNEDGNQTRYELYTNDDSDLPGLIVKVRGSHWEQDSPSKPGCKITDDDLWVASKVERVYPTIDEDHEPQIITDGSDVVASAYRLGFRNEVFWLATF